MLSKNPFNTGSPARGDDFFGRKKIIASIISFLRKKKENNLLIFGQRRIGKTSLLRKLQDAPELIENAFPVYFNLQDKASTQLHKLLYEIAGRIVSDLDLKIALKAGDFEVGNASFYFRKNFIPLVMERLLDKKQLLLLFDEFDVLGETEDVEDDSTVDTFASKRFIPFTATLIEEIQAKKYPFKFIFAVGRNYKDLEPKRFGQIMKFGSQVELAYFSKEETRQLLKSSDSSIPLDAEALDEIYSLTSGHPYLTQCLASVSFDAAEQNNAGCITSDIVRQSIIAAVKNYSSGVYWIWDSLSVYDRIILYLIAALREENHPVTMDSIWGKADSLNLTPVVDNLSQTLDKLKSFKFVKDYKKNQYDFYVEFIKKWITESISDAEIEKLLEKVDEDIEFHLNNSRYFFKKKEYKQAIQHYDDILKKSPYHFEALLYSAKCYNKLKNQDMKYLDKAVDFYKKSYDLNQRKTKNEYLSILLEKLKYLEANNRKVGWVKYGSETERILKEIQKVNPGDSKIKKKLVELYILKNKDISEINNLPEVKHVSILHLSEIHFKKNKDEKNTNFLKDVRNKLIDAVRKHSKEHGFPDFVAVTGDIAFTGKNPEYKEAMVFLNNLKSLLPKDTPIMPVPGNHDVDREKVSSYFSIHRIVKENTVDRFLEDKKSINNFVNVKFKAFRDFCKKLNPSLYKNEEDYFWVKNFDEKRVSFLGLNSSWASEGDDDRFQIALGSSQVYFALENAKYPYRIVLMHHPPFNWLEERDFTKYSGEIFNKCRLLLHGHVHFDSAVSISTPSDSCISLGANASYTKDGFIGFQFITVGFSEDGTTVTTWPYRLDTRERIAFFPDTFRWEGQKGKPYFKLETCSYCAGKEDKEFPPLHIPEQYREWVAQFFSSIDTELLDPNARAYHVPLPEVYIPIETSNPFHKTKAEKTMKERGKKDMMAGLEEDGEGRPKEPPYINIEELLGRQECILLRGPAGMGKTILVKHLAYTITHGQGLISLSGYLPVIIFLKDLWPIYQEKFSSTKSEIVFESLLNTYLETKVHALHYEVVEIFMSRDRALFLLDGLDEVPEQFRRGLVGVIAGFRLKNKANRFLLTGRPHGIDSGVTQHFGAFLQDIETLDDKKIKEFVSRWFRVVSGQAVDLADMTAAEMIGDIQINPHVSVFTQNPLLLTAVCILYLDNKRLPDQRSELYSRIVDNLLYRRFHQRTDPARVSRIEDYLKSLAFKMMTENRRTMDVGEAKELLKPLFPPDQNESPPQYKTRINALFNEIEPQCGLLKWVGDGEIEFFHLTFQEFLAARYILYMDMDYQQFLEKEWWEETLLLYTGLVNREWKDKANLMVREILTLSHKDAHVLRRLWLLGSIALRDIQAYKRDTEVTALAGEKLIAIIESNAPMDKRFEAGEILGILGDPRIKDYPMVKVEAGEFTMGGDRHDDEKPIHQVYLDEFMISKYPVTNEEFKAFVDEGGYTNKNYWTDEGWKWKEKEKVSEPGYWHDGKWNRPNFPVVGVSWYEAVAYANWLSKKTGEDFRLPTEAQWEKAARGTDVREYPWGDEFDKDNCNSIGCGLGRTSPVGIFPNGKSPYGCLDMAGNVWEWCSDWFDREYYKKSPVKNPTGPSNGSNRVLRGGYWFDVASYCRAVCRYALGSGYLGYAVGFRLLRSL